MTPLQKVAALVGAPRFLHLARLYPPYLGAGIRIRRAAPDLSRVEVEMPLRPWNQNFVGTQFGGSLYSMCDPFFMIMLMTRLGPGYVVWDRSASIEFVRPGRGTVRAVFELPDARLEEVRRDADHGGKVLPRFEVSIVDESGATVARVEKVLYVRRERRDRDAAPAGTPSRDAGTPGGAPPRRKRAAGGPPRSTKRRRARLV